MHKEEQMIMMIIETKKRKILYSPNKKKEIEENLEYDEELDNDTGPGLESYVF